MTLHNSRVDISITIIICKIDAILRWETEYARTQIAILEKDTMKKDTIMWIIGGGLIILLVAFIIFGVYLVNFMKATADRALAPVEQANAEIRTQVASILNPTPTIIPDPITIIRDIRTLARLETIQYTVEKVITAEVGQEEFAFLFGDRLLFVAHGLVIAGVDMRSLDEDDFKIEGENVFITMPPAEIFVATLDNDKSYVYDREQGILTQGDPNLETQARQVAEDEILNAALEDGILDQAQENAEVFLEFFLQNLGFQEVVFVYEADSD